MRLITSPILSTEDTDAIIGAENQDGSAFLRLEAALLENVEIPVSYTHLDYRS